LANAWSVVRKSRTYQLCPDDSESIVNKWDIADGQLTLFCLLSPLHLPLTILRSATSSGDEVSIII